MSDTCITNYNHIKIAIAIYQKKQGKALAIYTWNDVLAVRRPLWEPRHSLCEKPKATRTVAPPPGRP